MKPLFLCCSCCCFLILKSPFFFLSEKHICFGSNNNLLIGEDDEGSCHCCWSSLQPGGVSTPEAADDWFLFYCFYFSFHCHSCWNHCPARLPDWKPSTPLSFWLIPQRPPRLRARQTEILFPLTPDLLRKKGRVLLAVGRSHHSLMTRLLWCPPPSLMARQSPMVASQLVVSRGSQAMFAGRSLTFIQSLGQED